MKVLDAGEAREEMKQHAAGAGTEGPTPAPLTITIATDAFENRHLPGANDYIRACRASKYGAASFKGKVESAIMWQLVGLPRIDYPVTVGFTWYEPQRRRDVDGISFGAKFVLDALVKKGVLAGDGQKHVVGLWHEFRLDAKRPRVVVVLHPAVV